MVNLSGKEISGVDTESFVAALNGTFFLVGELSPTVLRHTSDRARWHRVRRLIRSVKPE